MVTSQKHEEFLKNHVLERIKAKRAPSSASSMCSSAVPDASSSLDAVDKLDVDRRKSEEKTKVALAGLRQHHGLWDRCDREFKQILKVARTNKNTAGMPVTSTLEHTIERGGELDDELKTLEGKVLGCMGS